MKKRDLRTVRLMACADLAALMLKGRRRALESLVRELRRDRGIPMRFFEEVMVHLSLVLGFPHMLQGLELLRRHEPTRQALKLQSVPHGRLRRRGAARFRQVYGPQTDKVLDFFDSLADGMADWILTNVYGRVYARPGLTLSEREVLTIVALIAHRQKKQLMGHLRGALRAGMTIAELRRITRRLAERHRMSVGLASSGLNEIAQGTRGTVVPRRARKN